MLSAHPRRFLAIRVLRVYNVGSPCVQCWFLCAFFDRFPNLSHAEMGNPIWAVNE